MIWLLALLPKSVKVSGLIARSYICEQALGHEVVEAVDGVVVLVDILKGFSTMALVHRARGETT
jgi:D-beta-D-heptose 7-phosphate kinase/D-beta-D-heptose 1-phosphate adenosyltransferase